MHKLEGTHMFVRSHMFVRGWYTHVCGDIPL